MSNLTLKKLLSREAGQALSKLLAGLNEPLVVLDPGGQSLLAAGAGRPAGASLPVEHAGQLVGYVAGESGSPWPATLAELLALLYAQEASKKDLAAETLDKYRELHLLYRLSEKLGASLQPEAIAQVALNEVFPLIQANGGMVVLHPGDENQALAQIAARGEPYQLRTDLNSEGNLIERVIHTSNAELSNGLPASDYFTGQGQEIVSLICAPLKTKNQVLGAIILIGGPERQFSAGELKLLNAIALQTSPAIEIAHLHQLELQRAQLERDLQTALQVQSGLLPKGMPDIAGWRLAAHWQPARTVSGDFYDFIHFPEGKLGLVIADVSDKGMPAALVMANTRSVLRAVTASSGRRGNESPGKLLERVNEVLCRDMPVNMFVTCLLVILDPLSGRVCYANAGHNPPYQRTARGLLELRATGMPLGLFPGMDYEDKDTVIAPGDSLLMYSDGLVEAHSPFGEMFGYPRLRKLLAHPETTRPLEGEGLIQHLIAQLVEFTGPAWEQEDDVTLVAIERFKEAGS